MIANNRIDWTQLGSVAINKLIPEIEVTLDQTVIGPCFGSKVDAIKVFKISKAQGHSQKIVNLCFLCHHSKEIGTKE